MVLVYIDQYNQKIKKTAFEAADYASQLATKLGTEAVGLVLGSSQDDLPGLGKYGLKKVYKIANDTLNQLDAQVYSSVIAAATDALGADIVVLSGNVTGKAVAPRLSARLQAGLVTGAITLPDTSQGFVLKKAVFSGKAFANINIETAKKIITISPNAFSHQAGEGSAEVADLAVEVPAAKVKAVSSQVAGGQVALSDAEIVVSGGRGLKGPENWGMIEELAKLLGAATACSRPVADAHWRPHGEHVGQTGGAIAPNLYFAVGISGAIQHLAGVNRSKTIVVINKDPEAPFFKAADYGIVGDAFEVMPKIIDAVKKLKQ
ncbi:MAG: electron transfer flavoprotein subunit alpha/FixB family protein [Flavihumibacter sp.]